MILKKYKNYITYNKINESLELQGFKIIPSGSAIPSSGIVKFGIDCTGSRLHLGHMIPMRMVKKLKDSGCDIHILIGDFTGRIGDPSGRDAQRQMLDSKTTNDNAQAILPQIKRIIGSDITIRHNSEWFDKMTLSEIMGILSKFTVEYLMSRDAFQKRRESGASVGANEIIVPILQGIDSVKLNAVCELGGSDQEFNFLLTRDVQSIFGQKPEVCLLSPIINGCDGRKMSKSYGNCIFLDDSPKDVFGKAMSITDEVMHQWIPIFMEGADTKRHPMELKKELATAITNEIWPGTGETERKAFEATVQNKALPTDIPEVKAEGDFLGMVSKIGKVSRSEARRLIQSNAVGVNDTKVLDQNHVLNAGDVVKVGKRNYAKII